MTPKASRGDQAPADRGQLHEDDVAQLVGGVGRDAHDALVALDAQPLVVVGVAQVVGYVHVVSLHVATPGLGIGVAAGISAPSVERQRHDLGRDPRRRGCRPRPWYPAPRPGGT